MGSTEGKKFSRADFKGSSLKGIQKQNEENATQYEERKKDNYLKISEGKNKFRFFPAHPNENNPNNLYALVRSSVWAKVPDREDESKLVNRSFLNARIHSGQEKDIFEEFLKLATKNIQSSDMEAKEKMDLLNRIVDFQKGIKHGTKFISYAKNGDDERGLLEISKSNKDKLDTESLIEIEEEPDGVDIVSDPEDGVQVTITYDKKKPAAKKYIVSMGRKADPLTDEDFDWLMEQEPLITKYYGEDKFHKGTLELALKAIEIYDEENGLETFDTDEFSDIIDEIKSALPDKPNYDGDDSDDEDDGSPKKSKSSKKKTLGEMSKNELKQFILDEDLDIVVKRADDEESILDKIEAEIGLTANDYPEDVQGGNESTEDEPFEEEEEEEEEEESPRRRRTRRTRS